MRLNRLPRFTAVALGILISSSAAQATNGYFSHGYGVKAKGMGGASVAMTHDAFAGANNPAAAAFAGNRWDLGAEAFSPRRSASRVGGAFPVSADSDKTFFLIPEFGYNVALSEKIGLNLTVYGNGGMNTDYPAFANMGNMNIFGGQGHLGVDLMQLIIAPTAAYKLTDRAAVGVSPLFVYQRFKSYGLDAFTALSSAPGNVTNQGSDSSSGYGLRLGYLNRLSDTFSIGASYAPKIDMGRFKKYSGLFAEAGDFDIPANYALGIAMKATPRVEVALDFQRIEYSGVASVSNPSSNQQPLGFAQGPGFGWRDINVVKLGVQWEMDSTWTLRAGYNKGGNPIGTADVMFNVLAPGVIEQHVTLGATMKLSKDQEVSGFFMHARKNSVTGPAMPPPAGPGGTQTIEMYQNSLGVQYSKKF